MATRSKMFKAPAKALQSSTDWGAPILESAITLIGDETFYYRGNCVPTMAAEQTFEKVMAILWEVSENEPAMVNPVLREQVEILLEHRQESDSMDLFQGILAMLNHEDVTAYSFTREATMRASRMMLESFVRVLTGTWPGARIAEHLAAAWRVDPLLVPILDSALILVADHELNISSFTARCVASAGCSPYASVAAATHAFLGRRHGGNTERIRGLLHEADGQGSLYKVIESRVKRGDPVPGFGHKLYDADPRARFLLPRLSDRNCYIRQAQEAADKLLESSYPTVDFALVVMEKELALPEKSSTYLFYLGRLAGLAAHIMEQYAQNRPIRPRAQYVGIMPGEPVMNAWE
jgi:citrate synthase